MTLGQHLAELRSRLIRSVITLMIAFIAIYSYRDAAFEMVQGPHAWATAELNAETMLLLEERLLEAQEQVAAGEVLVEREDGLTLADPLVYFRPGYPEIKRLNADHYRDTKLFNMGADSGFFAKMRISFWLALFLAGPFILWEMWGFVASGLYRHERKVIYGIFPFSISLFVGGVMFGYHLMVPYALYFLGLDSLGTSAFETQIGLGEYLGFLKSLALALGVVFQLPVVMIALARIGLVEPKTFAKYRKHTIVGALVVAAILTPPDPVTQMMMAGPIILLYELGIHLSRIAWRKQDPDGPTEVAA